MHSILLGAAAHHVTVIGSSGDGGAFQRPLGVGQAGQGGQPSGLRPARAGRWRHHAHRETARPAPTSARPPGGETAGGGFSHLYARPAYQDGVPGISKMRGVPDVAGDADEPGGARSSSPAAARHGSSRPAAPAPPRRCGAGLIALADQYAHHDLGFVNPAIYRIARSSSYHKAFHDITTGSNTVTIGTVTAGYQAGPGWDPVTGWGSPNAQVLVPLLARLLASADLRVPADHCPLESSADDRRGCHSVCHSDLAMLMYSCQTGDQLGMSILPGAGADPTGSAEGYWLASVRRRWINEG